MGNLIGSAKRMFYRVEVEVTKEDIPKICSQLRVTKDETQRRVVRQIRSLAIADASSHSTCARIHTPCRLLKKKNTRETYGAQYNTHKHVAPLVKANVLPAICQWLRSRNTTVQIEVLRTLQVLAESPLATRRMVEPDLMKALTAQVTKQKNKVRSTGWLSQAYAMCSRAANNQTTNGTHTHTR